MFQYCFEIQLNHTHHKPRCKCFQLSGTPFQFSYLEPLPLSADHFRKLVAANGSHIVCLTILNHQYRLRRNHQARILVGHSAEFWLSGSLSVLISSRVNVRLSAERLVALSINARDFAVSLVVWIILKGTMGIRVDEEAEINGLDMAELGMEAYPDFTHR